MESLLYAFLEPNGAMRGTQNPHIVAAEGVVTVSGGAAPAPTISPLAGSYREQIEAIVTALEPIQPNVVAMDTFDTLADLTSIMTRQIQEGAPFELSYSGAN